MTTIDDWKGLRSAIKDLPCPSCPRNEGKVPVHIDRVTDPSKVSFLVISQEPGFRLRSMIEQNGPVAIENEIVSLCKGSPAGEGRKLSPKDLESLPRLTEVFGPFDPTKGAVYWTHALKCVPRTSDRDINREWRKCGRACQTHLMNEIWTLGGPTLNVLVIGKYALEMCLNAFDGQDIDQELSISEFMQSNQLPLAFKLKSKDGKVKNISLFVYTNPSSEVCKVKKTGGKMTVEELQNIETKRIRELLK